jgi:hypothetical protein
MAIFYASFSQLQRFAKLLLNKTPNFGLFWCFFGYFLAFQETIFGKKEKKLTFFRKSLAS